MHVEETGAVPTKVPGAHPQPAPRTDVSCHAPRPESGARPPARRLVVSCPTGPADEQVPAQSPLPPLANQRTTTLITTLRRRLRLSRLRWGSRFSPNCVGVPGLALTLPSSRPHSWKTHASVTLPQGFKDCRRQNLSALHQ